MGWSNLGSEAAAVYQRARSQVGGGISSARCSVGSVGFSSFHTCGAISRGKDNRGGRVAVCYLFVLTRPVGGYYSA